LQMCSRTLSRCSGRLWEVYAFFGRVASVWIVIRVVLFTGIK